MDALSALALAATLAATEPDPVAAWQPLVAEAAARCAISPDWIARVMRAESGGMTMRGGKPIRSPRGAMGLMQLMPGTWGDMRARLALGADPDDPHDNIIAGACYLRLLHDRFGYPGLFGAYNAGPVRYAAWLAGERSLPAETTAYLRTLGAEAPGPERPVQAPPPTLFAVRRDVPASDSASPDRDAGAGLFAIRKDQP